jgi:hypothetical protein
MVGFPLLLIPIAVYNIVVWLMPGVSLTDPLFRVTLLSHTDWPITLGDLLLASGILLILLEVIKGARPGSKYLMDHLLSLIVLGASAAEFLLWPKFGTSLYFLLALLALTDFITSIAQRTHHRRPAFAAARRADPEPAPVTVTPRPEPAPAVIVPAPPPAPVPTTTIAPDAPADKLPPADTPVPPAASSDAVPR